MDHPLFWTFSFGRLHTVEANVSETPFSERLSRARGGEIPPEKNEKCQIYLRGDWRGSPPQATFRRDSRGAPARRDPRATWFWRVSPKTTCLRDPRAIPHPNDHEVAQLAAHAQLNAALRPSETPPLAAEHPERYPEYITESPALLVPELQRRATQWQSAHEHGKAPLVCAASMMPAPSRAKNMRSDLSFDSSWNRPKAFGTPAGRSHPQGTHTHFPPDLWI